MGLEIDILWLTVLMFGSLAILLMAGLPLSFVTGGLACVFLFVFGDVQMLNILPSRIFPLMTDYQLSAIPLFIFMASMLERAGIIEELFDMVYKLLGGLRGGLAISTIIASTILAILFVVVAQQSVGELFIGAVIPGLILSSLYIAYVSVRCTFNPAAGPPIPVEERVSTAEKLRLLKNMFAPMFLVVLVLGIIFGGIATPVEAAGVGTFGAIVVSALHRNLTWVNLRFAALTTLRVTGMVLWIIFGAPLFVGFHVVNGGQQFVNDVIIGTGLGPYGILVLMMFILVVLGMFPRLGRDPAARGAHLHSAMKTMSFDGVFGLPGVAPDDLALWFGVVYMVNMQMSFLSPPFGYALFYLKSVAPPGITMTQIYRSSLPFLCLQAVGLGICIVFPEVVLWLPRLVYG